MTAEERIELIKWGCQYADGFDWHEAVSWEFEKGPVGIDEFLFINGHQFCQVKEFIEAFWYPLFLQRVIEGINREEQWLIIQDASGIMASLISSWRQSKATEQIFGCAEKGGEDQAKESALFWIKSEMEN